MSDYPAEQSAGFFCLRVRLLLTCFLIASQMTISLGLIQSDNRMMNESTFMD